MPQYIYDSINDEYIHNHCINCYKDMSNSAASLCFNCEDELIILMSELVEEVRN